MTSCLEQEMKTLEDSDTRDQLLLKEMQLTSAKNTIFELQKQLKTFSIKTIESTETSLQNNGSHTNIKIISAKRIRNTPEKGKFSFTVFSFSEPKKNQSSPKKGSVPKKESIPTKKSN